MKPGLRIFAIMTVAFSLLPALCADDTAKSGATAKKDRAVDSRVAPGAVAKFKPAATASASLPAAAVPQSGGADGNGTPRVELFLGYSYIRNVGSNAGNRIAYLHGGSTSLAFNLNRYLGLVADFGGFHADRFGPGAPPIGGIVDASGNAFTYMFGPRVSFRHEAVTPFAQALFGQAHAGTVTLNNCSGIGCTPLPSENAFAMTAGGGVDVTLRRHVALRVFQAEYLMTRFADRSSLTGQRGGQNDWRLSVGLVFRFGGAHPPARVTPPPPPPAPPAPAAEPQANGAPTLICSADRSVMVLGERAQILALASDPDNDRLTFSWYTNGGRIIGSGSSVRLDGSGLAPGRYTVTGRVDDGRGGAADCSIDLDVFAAPQAIPPVVLEKVLGLHSIYFPTAQPTDENPNLGLVPSQQAILRTLAADFKRYDAIKPGAHLMLEGHADERASVEYNNVLAERRVALSKRFLVEQGVPEASIETHSFGEHQELDESQVRQQMEENPELTPEQRTRLYTNMKSIILAQNRRVDIVLTTTGQKSVRRYPFNAKDALTLLDDRQLMR